MQVYHTLMDSCDGFSSRFMCRKGLTKDGTRWKRASQRCSGASEILPANLMEVVRVVVTGCSSVPIPNTMNIGKVDHEKAVTKLGHCEW